jgi:hypothetical protein
MVVFFGRNPAGELTFKANAVQEVQKFVKNVTKSSDRWGRVAKAFIIGI